jgi:hypothetical protein
MSKPDYIKHVAFLLANGESCDAVTDEEYAGACEFLRGIGIAVPASEMAATA